MPADDHEVDIAGAYVYPACASLATRHYRVTARRCRFIRAPIPAPYVANTRVYGDEAETPVRTEE